MLNSDTMMTVKALARRKPPHLRACGAACEGLVQKIAPEVLSIATFASIRRNRLV